VLTICRGLIHTFTFSKLRDLRLVELSRILSTGDSAAIPFQMYPKSSGQSHRQVARSPSSARHELLAWAKARNLRDRAAGYSNDARVASDSGVQRRLNDIAQHYRLAAAAEAKDAGRLGNERREKSKASENGGSDGRPEIETLRLKLRQFASQQTDQIVQARCLAVDQTLAEISEGNDLNLRQVLANHIQSLEQALRRSGPFSQSNEASGFSETQRNESRKRDVSNEAPSDRP
jgi:hypothetical protein